MAGNYRTPAEEKMYDTIKWLLELPKEERDRLEAAESHCFTQNVPAGRISDARVAGKSTELATLDLGSVEAAELLYQRGWRPALLNFAHGYNCGGGFEHAGGSQEEDIFRKSSCFLSLWPHRRVDDGPGVLARGMWIGEFDEALPRKDPFYPHSQCGGVYSPHVRVIRKCRLPGAPLERIQDVEKLPLISLLTLAAQDCGRDGPFDPALLREKVRTLLYMAAIHAHDALVLGAFGCGFFRNPVDEVAEAYQELLGPGGEFERAFRLVVFAVPGGFGATSQAFTARFSMVDHRDPATLTKGSLSKVPALATSDGTGTCTPSQTAGSDCPSKACGLVAGGAGGEGSVGQRAQASDNGASPAEQRSRCGPGCFLS